MLGAETGFDFAPLRSAALSLTSDLVMGKLVDILCIRFEAFAV